jgi:peptidoglycan/xylan/chitin deacetylase (PgdA/CDA1 family)
LKTNKWNKKLIRPENFQMENPNVLVIADKMDTELLIPKTDSENWNIYWETVNYNEIFMNVSRIRESVIKNKIDFVIYSRNDQVANRTNINKITSKMETGYSSFSGIDEKFRIEQMRICFEDFIQCNKKLDFNFSQEKKTINKTCKNTGTFSLLFDAEQLGCFRYGLTRIMGILDEYNVKATFFVTNIMKKVYSNAIDLIKKRGHEVGIHGQWHEQLSDFDVVTQTKMINKMKNDFSNNSQGANFVGRMDNASISALVTNNFVYFLYLSINYYQPFSYPKLSATPFSILSDEGSIWALPISINTYSLPWFSIKNMVDSAVILAKKNRFSHISVLLHPFRDGNLQHLRTTQRLIKYLAMDIGLRPITLEQFAGGLKAQSRLPVVKYEEFETLTRSKRILRFPETKQDVLGFSEAFIRIYKLLKKNCDVF